jgi:hypothetical protein
MVLKGDSLSDGTDRESWWNGIDSGASVGLY